MKEQDTGESISIFEAKPFSTSGIDFQNTITESDSLNYFTFPYLFMGGGVAIGDFNNDGQEDVFFTANQEANRLYINKGNFQFEDITKSAGVDGDGRWYTGVSLVDINSDGWLDIYLSVSGSFEPRNNQLFINNGDLTFIESAEEYALDDPGFSQQGSFFDYDRDGDLDLFVINYSPFPFNAAAAAYRRNMDKPRWFDSNHLYENVEGQFIDITKKAGLLHFGLSISASISDFNNDGWPDIYICNDFASPDYFFINDGNGGFKDYLSKSFAHTSLFSMGSDAADVNGDGNVDMVQLDMNPANNFRNKANMASMNIERFWEQVNNGLHYQYMQNTFQLNSGVIDSLPHFSDIARLTGVSSTDWSWAALLFDVNNDKNRDLFITNGIRRDINNRDYFSKMEGDLMFADKHKYLEASLAIPSEAVPNYLYVNEGNLKFKDISASAGLEKPSFSNGMAYGDLDNDGDLDVVINNIDQEAFLYENKTQVNSAKYLQIVLEGDSLNQHGIGSKVKIYHDGEVQLIEQYPARGFLSSVSNILHFGLGTTELVDSLEVSWSAGGVSKLYSIACNQRIVVDEKMKQDKVGNQETIQERATILQKQDGSFGIEFIHQENEFDDFTKQVLLPHKMSNHGPSLVVADFDGDGLEDVFFGDSVGHSAELWKQLAHQEFVLTKNLVFDKYSETEDVDASAIDVDGDGDLDLYVVSGGNEFEPNAISYKDKLYLNDGKGNFEEGTQLLPDIRISGSVVRPYDYDSDGDMDIFIGGRHMPHHYPTATDSYILENQDGKFQIASIPSMGNLGMVTDAVWFNANDDDRIDLMVVGEWMTPLLFIQQEGNSFDLQQENQIGLDKMNGWWFSIEKGDLDNDGDEDLVLGNLGENYKYQASLDQPFKLYTKDFNSSGTTDIVLSYHQNGNYYPVRGKQCSSEQIPELKEKFHDYNSFAKADISAIYGDLGLNNATELNAYTFSSTVLINQNGKFTLVNLPIYSQISSINDILIKDLNADNNLDLLVVGNLYSSEIETTRNDASLGCIMLGQGNGSFEALQPLQSGLGLVGDIKKIRQIQLNNDSYLIFAVNNESPQIYKIKD